MTALRLQIGKPALATQLDLELAWACLLESNVAFESEPTLGKTE